MKVIEHLDKKRDNPLISVEIIPPKRGGNVNKIYEAIESILPFNPPFIDVTSHSAEIIWEELPDGSFKKRVKRKRPGTIGLCAAIKYKYNIDPVPHILCNGFTREETEDAMVELHYLGIENLLAIRGDGKYIKPISPEKTVNEYALDLVGQLSAMNKGEYLDEDLINAARTNFCIGVACYPEKHFESPNLKYDLKILKNKQDQGADYAVSQMFFESQKFIDYVAEGKKMGVTIPIVPGMKILTSKKQLTNIPKFFYINLPEELTDRMMAAKTRKQEIEVGTDWAVKQSLELLESGVTNLHFYIMQNTLPFLRFMEKLKKKI